MSENLLRVLRMPPEKWRNGEMGVAIRHSAYKDAAKKIEKIEKLEIFRDTVGCLLSEGVEFETPKTLLKMIGDALKRTA